MVQMEFFREFVLDTNEQFERIEDSIVKLEKGYSNEEADRLFRAFHTLKGNATLIGLTNVSDLSHAVEGMVGDVRKGHSPMSNSIADIILTSIDVIKGIIKAAETPGKKQPDPSKLIVKIGEYRKKSKAKSAGTGQTASQRLNIKSTGNLAILEIPERFDKSYTGGFVAEIKSLCKRGIKQFVFNFNATGSILPVEIDAFLIAKIEIEKNGSQMASCDVSSKLMDDFKSAGKAEPMNIQPKLKHALEFLKVL